MTPEKNDSQPAEDFPKPSKKRCCKLLILSFVFVLGVIFGGAVTIFTGRHFLQIAIKHPEQMPARITNRLTRKLDLTAEQKVQVQAILTEGQQQLMAIRTETQPKVQKELDILEEKISTVLNEKQRSEWQQLFNRMRRQWSPPLNETDLSEEDK